MLDFPPKKKHVVLFDAVIQREHLGPFSVSCLHSSVLFLNIFLQLLSFNLHSCSACCPLIPVTVFCSQLSPKFSLPLSIPASFSPSPSSHPNITQLLFFFPSLVCSSPFYPSTPCLPGFLRSPRARGGGEKITTW